jgi:hypothetical protein
MSEKPTKKHIGLRVRLATKNPSLAWNGAEGVVVCLFRAREIPILYVEIDMDDFRIGYPVRQIASVEVLPARD